MAAPAASTDTRPARRGRKAAAGVAAGVVLLCGLLAAPWPPRLLPDVHGDVELAEQVRPLLADPADRISVAYLEAGSVRFAGFGADEHTEFEIGSVTKTFTASLLADAVSRGEVTLETTVAEILGDDLADPQAAIGTVTLAELASHRSGLPRLAPGWASWRGLLAGQFLHRDPYPASAEQVIAQAQDAALNDRGTVNYSNLGYAFLGQLLATAAGQDYDELLRSRLLQPLGLRDTHLPVTAANLPEDAPAGRSAGGHREGPWTLNGSAPAGGIRSTARDMAAYAEAQLDGTAPGAAALEPQWPDGESGDRYGLAWVTSAAETDAGVEVTWHNGQTGGFAAMVALDRSAGRAVVILSNVSHGQEEAALKLLRQGLT